MAPSRFFRGTCPASCAGPTPRPFCGPLGLPVRRSVASRFTHLCGSQVRPLGPICHRSRRRAASSSPSSPWTSTPPPSRKLKKVLEGREARRSRHRLGVWIPGPTSPAARMDQRKALFRAKLREAKEKQEKRIDPSLVRSPPPPSLSLPPIFGTLTAFLDRNHMKS